MTTPHPSLRLTDGVADALRAGAPVVALESTIISHGMPWPRLHLVRFGLARRRNTRPASLGASWPRFARHGPP